MFRRPHSVFINPYDAEKHVWVVDDRQHAVYKFTNDGKQLVQTIGVSGVAGDDATHFNRPTFLTWLPDSTMYVADGYANTRVVKFDKDGKFLTAWGRERHAAERHASWHLQRGARRRRRSRYAPGVRHRPVERSHPGIRRKRQVPRSVRDRLALDAAGAVHVGGQALWIVDNDTSKIVKYDMDGRYLYSWGSRGEWPGALWNVHGMSVDQEGNLYLAEVNNGRAQKFRPRPGADPALMVGKPVRSAW